MKSPKKSPAPTAPTTSTALAAITEAIASSRASHPVRCSALVALDNLRGAMAGCGLNSTPAAASDGMSIPEALTIIVDHARLLRPTINNETARTTLASAFITLRTSLRNVAAL
jgi:hypothetical protein